MKCSNPFIITFTRDGIQRSVRCRCRQCLACRITYREQWSARIKGELQTQSSKGSFVTLTYDDYNVPRNSNGDMFLQLSDLQKFFKRLRIYLERHYPHLNSHFKYYAVGEYGELSSKIGSGRPHFHFILSGVSYWDSNFRKAVSACWRYGFNTILPANSATIRYCLKYMDKQFDCKKACIDKGLPPPFSVKSLGIGALYMIRNYAKLCADKGFRVKKSVIGIPPYWSKRFNFPAKDMSSPFKFSIPCDMPKSLARLYFNSKYYPNFEKFLSVYGKQKEYILSSAYNVGKEY